MPTVFAKDGNLSLTVVSSNDLLSAGVMTTPVTVIDGQTVIGYDLNRLKTLFGL